jgi:peptidoglycan/LPS O-acetylase OafA/YrhL
VGNGVTRATIVWIVAAAAVGGVAGVLWVMRSELGGAHTGTVIVVGSIVLTLLAAALLYHGIMVAAREQDRRSDLVAQRRRPARPAPAPQRPKGPPPADDEPLTFRRGKQI